MSAEHDNQEIRTLFDDIPMPDTVATRDLIGPAVAWGRTRRRIDRLAVVGATSALAVAAVVGAVTLRPGGGSQDAVSAATGATTSYSQAAAVKKLITVEEFYKDFNALLPQGYHVDPDMPSGGFTPTYIITGPTGKSWVQFDTGSAFIVEGPADSSSFHPHQPTAQIPLVSGKQEFAEGTVAVESRDVEVRNYASDNEIQGSPHAVVGLDAQYGFTSAGPGTKSFHIELGQIVTTFPWKDGKSAIPPGTDLWGYSPTGPVLSPEQFAKIAADPRFAALVQEQSELLQQRSGVSRQPTGTAAPTIH